MRQVAEHVFGVRREGGRRRPDVQQVQQHGLSVPPARRVLEVVPHFAGRSSGAIHFGVPPGESHPRTFSRQDSNLWLNHALTSRINLRESYREGEEDG